MIADRSIAWLEIDSTSLASNGKPIAVDGLVIGCQDGRLVCCQCKKNQTNFDDRHARNVGSGRCRLLRSRLGHGSGMMNGPMMGWGHMRGYYSGLSQEQMRQRQYMMDQYMPMQQMMMDHMMWHQRWTSPQAPAATK